MDTAKFDDAYFKAADKKKGSSKKTEGEFFNEVCLELRLETLNLRLLTLTLALTITQPNPNSNLSSSRTYRPRSHAQAALHLPGYACILAKLGKRA